MRLGQVLCSELDSHHHPGPGLISFTQLPLSQRKPVGHYLAEEERDFRFSTLTGRRESDLLPQQKADCFSIRSQINCS